MYQKGSFTNWYWNCSQYSILLLNLNCNIVYHNLIKNLNFRISHNKIEPIFFINAQVYDLLKVFFLNHLLVTSGVTLFQINLDHQEATEVIGITALFEEFMQF